MDITATETVGRSHVALAENQLAVPRLSTSPEINRARLRELIDLAYETVAWLESKGLKYGEQCAFRQAAEQIWFTPK